MTPKSLIAPARLARRPVLATQTDARLVDLVRAGYEPAFEAIVTRYRAALLRYVGRFLPRERAEDAVQQSFVSAYEAMLRNDAELNLRPWLYRIAHNTALNVLRDRGMHHEELHEGIDGVERPEQALERAQGLRDVLTAVQALPERQRDAIVLRELEGRSYDEIALKLGVSGGSVRQLLNRARHTLRAGATAVLPVGLVLRIPWAAPGEPVAARVAELCGVGAAGALATKVCATALVTGAVAGGVAVVPEVVENEGRNGRPPAAGEGRAQSGDRLGSRGGPGSLPEAPRVVVEAPGPTNRGSGGAGDGAGDRSGRGDGEAGSVEDNSGRGSGSSGSGSGSSGSESDGSGSGSGSSGSGSGRGSSGSGSSGSSSGGGSSGSGSSGSGSDGSGSGSGGSGSSGGSSGSSEPESASVTGTPEPAGDSGSGGSGDGESGSGSGDSSGPAY